MATTPCDAGLNKFFFGNLLFFFALGNLYSGTSAGIYLGLCLVIGMILLIGRRIIPAFINSGVDAKVIHPRRFNRATAQLDTG